MSILAFQVYKMQKEIIVIIGGPGSGKTSIIENLKAKGFCCFEEVSRQVTLDAKAQGIDQLFLTDPNLFSQKLLEGRITQFKDANENEHSIVFIDRGIPDIVAYMEYIGDDYLAEFHVASLENIYSKIFVLPPWQEIYVSDNERYESYKQAQEIHVHLVNTYKLYGYDLIYVPKDTIENRVLYILEKIS